MGVGARPQVASQIIGDSVCVCVWGRMRRELRLPIPHRNMALFRGLLVLSLSCLQVPCLVASLGRDLRGEGRQVWKKPEV